MSRRRLTNNNNALNISVDTEKQEDSTELDPGPKLEILGVHENDEVKTDDENKVEQSVEENNNSFSNNEPSSDNKSSDNNEEKKDPIDNNTEPEASSSEETIEKKDNEGEKDNGEKVFTKAQLEGILNRNSKKLTDQISDLQKQLAEAKEQTNKALKDGMEKGRISQRKTEIAKRYGFKETILPETSEGLDEFESQIEKYEKGHERVIPARKLDQDENSSWILGAR